MIYCDSIAMTDLNVVLKGNHLDSVLRVVATSVHIKTGVHAAA